MCFPDSFFFFHEWIEAFLTFKHHSKFTVPLLVLSFSLSFRARMFVLPTRFASNREERRGHLVRNFTANVKLHAWVSVLLLLPVWLAGWVDWSKFSPLPSSTGGKRCVASPTGVIIPGYGSPYIAVADTVFARRVTSREWIAKNVDKLSLSRIKI